MGVESKVHPSVRSSWDFRRSSDILLRAETAFRSSSSPIVDASSCLGRDNHPSRVLVHQNHHRRQDKVANPDFAYRHYQDIPKTWMVSKPKEDIPFHHPYHHLHRLHHHLPTACHSDSSCPNAALVGPCQDSQSQFSSTGERNCLPLDSERDKLLLLHQRHPTHPEIGQDPLTECSSYLHF